MELELLKEKEVSAEPALTPEVLRETAPIYQRVRHIIPEIEWPVHAPYIAAIMKLKVERKAVILAHNYQTPEIFHGVADLLFDKIAPRLARLLPAIFFHRSSHELTPFSRDGLA